MHDGEIPVEQDVVRRLVATQLPEAAVQPLRRLETWGTDHVIFRLGEDLSVRLPKIDWAAAQGELESRWLPVLAPHLPVEVAVPLLVGEPDFGYPFRWYVAPWLHGVNPDPADDQRQLACDLAAFVRALGAVEPQDAPAPRDGQRGGPLAAADASTRDAAEELRDVVDVEPLLAVWTAGVEAPPWQGPTRWVHGDLMAGNLLLRDRRLRAVIDWGGLTAGDPAVELMVAWSLFDPQTRGLYRDGLGFVDDDMWLRGRAWAVSAALHALPYYRDTNPDIVARSWRTVRALLDEPL
jgi:aminoglycoside phosphotransferase (APT) family kinase protein